MESGIEPQFIDRFPGRFPVTQIQLRIRTYAAMIRNALWRVPLLVLLAALSTGLTVGWSTGQAGLDSGVLAAVLPVILTGVTGGAGAIVLRFANRPHSPSGDPALGNGLVVLATMAVIIFSVGYFGGAVTGRNMSDHAKEKAQTDLVARQYTYVVRCTEELVRLNNLRQTLNEAEKKFNLELLTLAQVCIALTRSTSPQHPLVAVAEGEWALPLSPATEKKHYEFLEECTSKQADAHKADGKQTIGHVCPALARGNRGGRG